MKTYGDFPEIIQEVIKIRVGPKYNHGTKSTNNHLGDGFDWESSPEGFDFWDKVLRDERNEVFFDKYPLSPSLYPCNQRDKCIARVDIPFEGIDIKRGTVLNNGSGHLSQRLCDYNRYMKQFNPILSKQEDDALNIDYSKKDWWKILEVGDEVIVIDKGTWSRTELGTIIPVVEDDIIRIKENKEEVHSNNNQHCVNFTSNMVKLHKKKNKQSHNFYTHESDLSADSGTIRQPVGTGRISIPSGKCQIATSSRLVGATKSIGGSPPTIKNGVFSPVQLIKHH